jgi:oxygen-dependent protoporphyrinogen oxidase
MSQTRVLVVGGGITGLSAAFTLQEEARRRGLPLDLRLLEAGGEPGGHAHTIEEDGFLVEAGPNGFLAREPETLALVEELGLGPRLVEALPEAKRRFIVRGGRLRRVPESPPTFVTSDALSLRGKLRLAGELFAPGPPEGVDETVFEFARRRIGAEAAEMLVDAAVSGISAGDSRALSVAAQFPLMVEMEREHGGLIRAMFARRKTGPGGSRLLSFDRGLRTLTATIADRLGTAVCTGTAARSIDQRAGGWRVETDRGVLDADELVLALAARTTAPLVAPLDWCLADALGQIPYSGVSVVALAYRNEDIGRGLDGYGYLVTRPEKLATLGVVWESSLFPGRAPEGMALLRVFLGGARQPGLVGESEQGAEAIAREELQRVMGIVAEPERRWVFRWPHAIAQYTVGHLERLAAIRDRAGRHRGLTLCGTSYDGVSFNHAIVSGRRAARRVADRLEAAAGEPAAERRAG